MNDSNRRAQRGGVLRVVLIVVGVLSLLVIAGVIGFNVYLKRRYEPTIRAYQEKAASTVDTYCAEARKLAADPFFHEQRAEGDAAAVLNGWVAWESIGGAPPLPEGSPLALSAELTAALKEKDRWLEGALDVSQVDFGWMQKLHAYDRWSLTAWPGRGERQVPYMNLPIPNLVPLQHWAKLRLRDGIDRREPLAAAKDVRQLAWLLYRTDSLLGEMFAVALLKLERRARDAHPELSAGWTPMETAQLERFRAVGWGGVSYASVAVTPEVARKARTCATPAIGACAGLTEAAGFGRFLEPLLRDGYRESYDELARALAETGCPTELPRAVWAASQTIDDAPTALDPEAGPVARMPRFAVPVVGGILLATSLRTDKLDAFAAAPAP